jgi:molybdopterin molybdotransferase
VTTPIHLSYAEARARVLAAVRPLAARPTALEALAGRPLLETLRAAYDLPPFPNSAMDGYAVHAVATVGAPVELPVVAVVPAGRVATRALGPNEAMRIMTGAMIPTGADAIVPFEDAERIGSGKEERVRVLRAAAPGAHVRAAGRDLTRGAIVFEAGRALSPHDVALLAALGSGDALAGPRPRVGVLSTGDELLSVRDPLVPGAIRDSNLPMLAALAAEAGGDVVLAERVGDDPEAVTNAIRRALDTCDAVMTIGGVSAGDFDPVKESLHALGAVELWRVAMRPGRPQAFGTPGGRLFFGLPGNPASVACVFEAIVRPALRKAQGFASIDRPRVRVRAAERIVSKPGRTDFVRVTLEPQGDGWRAAPAGEQTSGHLTPQSRAHALAIVPEAAGAVAAGEPLDALVLRWPDPSNMEPGS